MATMAGNRAITPNRARTPHPWQAAPGLSPETPIIAIGDVHGRLDLLDGLMPWALSVAARLGGQIVLLGDYVDRGPESAGVLAYLRLMLARNLPITPLAGNHEQMLLEFLRRPTLGRAWLRHGGRATLKSFGVAPPPPAADMRALSRAAPALDLAMPEATQDFLAALPLSFRSGNLFCSHAGRSRRRPVTRQPAATLLWGRGVEEAPAPWTPAQRRSGWSVQGHVTTALPLVGDNRISIDTGAWKTGRLTAALIQKGRIEFHTT